MFDESKHKRDAEGKFTEFDSDNDSDFEEYEKEKSTKEEKSKEEKGNLSKLKDLHIPYSRLKWIIRKYIPEEKQEDVMKELSIDFFGTRQPKDLDEITDQKLGNMMKETGLDKDINDEDYDFTKWDNYTEDSFINEIEKLNLDNYINEIHQDKTFPNRFYITCNSPYGKGRVMKSLKERFGDSDPRVQYEGRFDVRIDFE